MATELSCIREKVSNYSSWVRLESSVTVIWCQKYDPTNGEGRSPLSDRFVTLSAGVLESSALLRV